MASRTKSQAGWTDVKAKLASFDRKGLHSSDLGYQDESYFDALVRMFNQAVATANRLPVGSRDALIVRLDRVRSTSHELGYGVGDDMDSILARYTKRKV
jgi:hypothetical protein